MSTSQCVCWQFKISTLPSLWVAPHKMLERVEYYIHSVHNLILYVHMYCRAIRVFLFTRQTACVASISSLNSSEAAELGGGEAAWVAKPVSTYIYVSGSRIIGWEVEWGLQPPNPHPHPIPLSLLMQIGLCSLWTSRLCSMPVFT